MTRVRVVFYGRVQGVGFRWNAVQAASELKVTGYVKNLSDGSVELIVQGDRQDIDTLLERIRFTMAGCIERVDLTTLPVKLDDMIAKRPFHIER